MNRTELEPGDLDFAGLHESTDCPRCGQWDCVCEKSPPRITVAADSSGVRIFDCLQYSPAWWMVR